MLRVTMLTLRLPTDPADAAGLPLHERVAAAVRRALAEGQVPVGGLLPPARDLAVALDVHPNTVLRAYRALRDEGLVDLRAGRGARVLPGADATAALAGPIDALLRAAARAGIDVDDLTTLVRARAGRRRSTAARTTATTSAPPPVPSPDASTDLTEEPS
jgi:GntR family transcriptional regulator